MKVNDFIEYVKVIDNGNNNSVRITYEGQVVDITHFSVALDHNGTYDIEIVTRKPALKKILSRIKKRLYDRDSL